MPRVPVGLPVHYPHDKQRDFMDSPAKRKVIVAGRRGGKTTGVSDLAMRAVWSGRRVLEAAPTVEQTDAFWQACKVAMGPALRLNLVYKNETERVLRVRSTGAQIKAKTAWNADTLRGDYADLLILDEFSLMDPNTWDEVGAPMLLDNNGDAVFIFTPKRRNHAFTFYQRALADTTGRWAAWHFTSYDNPYLSQEALAEIMVDMSEDAYKQEILAQFLEGEGQVFRNLNAVMVAPDPAEVAAHQGHHLVAGIDWGQVNDFTAMSVLCTDCMEEVARDRFNKIEYRYQRRRLVSTCATWGVRLIVPEQNSMGRPNIEELRQEAALARVVIRPFDTTAQSKPNLIEGLALAFEQEKAHWQADPVWTGELEAYERSINPKGGHPAYSAPEGMNDDTVIARALAWQGVGMEPALRTAPGLYR